MVLLWILTFLALLNAQQVLEDGQSIEGHIQNPNGGELFYQFHIGAKTSKNLSIVLTTFSDWSDPDIYVKKGKKPTKSDYDWESATSGTESLVIPDKQLSSNSDYFILVSCQHFCRYVITLSYTKEINLVPGIPQTNYLEAGYQVLYKFETREEFKEVEITASVGFGKFDMFVSEGDIEPGPENTLIVDDNSHMGKSFFVENFKAGAIYKIAIVALNNTEYTIISSVGKDSVMQLRASVSVLGMLEGENQCNYYSIFVDHGEETLVINLTPFYGLPDIFVKVGKKPSTIEYDYFMKSLNTHELKITKADRERKNQPIGFYYIGICSAIHSSYSLCASMNQNSTTKLAMGIPSIGAVEYQKISYFYIEFSTDKAADFSIHLTPTIGSADLYAKLCSTQSCEITLEQINSNDKSLIKSKHNGSVQVIDISTENVSGITTKYLVGVIGSTLGNNYFSLIANFIDSETLLLDGQPLQSSIPSQGYQYFKYELINPNAEELKISLTPIAGNPDLYLSKLSKPSIFDYEKSSNKKKHEVDQVSYTKGSQDGEDLSGTYHIAVYSKRSSTFTILVKEDIKNTESFVQLVSGIPQRNNLSSRDYCIYYFTINFSNENKESLGIYLTPITGKYTIYIKNKGPVTDWRDIETQYSWKTGWSTSNQISSISIDKDDENYLLSSIYYVLVMATEIPKDESPIYSILFTTENSPVLLTENIPIDGEVKEKHYKYYTFPIYLSHEDVTISLNAMSGDPDLYISADENNKKPTKENKNFESQYYGSEIVTLSWNNDLKRLCPSLPDDYKHGNQTHCSIYIGVYGSTSSRYTIRVHTKNSAVRQLMLSSPETSYLNKTEDDYYFVIFDSSKPLKITIQSSIGDADIFANIYSSGSFDTEVSQWPVPSRTNSTFQSLSSIMTDEISLIPSQYVKTCSNTNCIAIITVNCFSDTCKYSIITQQDDIAPLSENTPTYGFVEKDSYKVFSFYCSNNASELMITLTSFSEEFPNMYVSRGAMPTMSVYDWIAKKDQESILRISSNDPKLRRGMTGTFFIAIYGETASSFSIIIHSGNQNLTWLHSGTPQYGSLNKGSKTYYLFNSEVKSDISISLAPYYGNPAILVYTYSGADDVGTVIDKLKNYIWSSNSSPDKYSIQISKNDPNFCINCVFIIEASTSQNSSSSFTITVTNSQDTIILPNGIPYKNSCQKDEIQVYTFLVSSSSDIDFSITSYMGDTDIYIGTVKNTSDKNFNWTALSHDKIDHLRIRSDDKKFKIGTFYIYVKGVEDGIYTITAHLRNSYARLMDGRPMVYRLQYSPFDHIYFDFESGISRNFSGPVHCQLTSLSKDFFPQAYVDFQRYDKPRPPPSEEKSNFKFQKNNYDFAFNSLSMIFRETGIPGKLNFMISGSASERYSQEESGDFEFYCSESIIPTMLAVGSENYDSIDLGILSKRYEVNLNELGRLEVFLVPCAEDLKLEISSNWTIASDEDPEVIVERKMDGKIIGMINNAKGRYFITVSALSKNVDSTQNYQLSTVFTKQGQSAPKYIVPGNNGLIKWERPDKYLVVVSFDSIEYQDGSPIENPNNIEYHVYYSKISPNLIETTCDMQTSHKFSKAQHSGYVTGKNEIRFLVKEKRGFINILAINPSQERIYSKYVSYDPTEIYIESGLEGEGVAIYIFWAVCVLLWASLMGSLYFYRKMKRANRRLEYEMADVRNIASVSSGKIHESVLSEKIPFYRAENN